MVSETSGGAASCGGSFAERCQGKNDNHRGAQRSDHGPAEAERLIQNALEALEWNEEGLLAAKSVQPEKQAIAWLIKTHTAVSGIWIAERLRMGHRTPDHRGGFFVLHCSGMPPSKYPFFV